MKAKSNVPSSGRMYLDAIASMWIFTSRANALPWSWRASSSCASTNRSKLSSGNLASTGTSFSTRMTASTLSPLRNVCWSEYALCGSRSASRFASRSSPKPPRAFGGRSSCWSCQVLRLLRELRGRPPNVAQLLVDRVRLLGGVLEPPVDLRVELGQPAVHRLDHALQTPLDLRITGLEPGCAVRLQ